MPSPMQFIRKIIRYILGTILILIGLIWIYGEFTFPEDNPREVYLGTILSMESDAVLNRSCFDCHSSVTRRPWYSNLPLAGWLIGHHIEEGRAELNFSRWGRYSGKEKRKLMQKSIESIEEGEMPDFAYLLLHSEAKVSPAELARLREDAKMLGLLEKIPSENEEHGEKGKKD